MLDNVKVGLHNQIYLVRPADRHPAPAPLLPQEKEREMNRRGHGSSCKIFRLGRTRRTSRPASLPYGKQRKLEIARALATDPKLLLLDEPAAGMNPNETDELMQTVRSWCATSSASTILLIEHDMKLCHGHLRGDHRAGLRPTVIARGRRRKQIRNNPKVIAAYLGG